MSNESGYKVPLTTIKEVKMHPNADRLDIVIVYGFEIIIGRDSKKVGDKVLYIPIDSIIPQNLENHLFPEDSKIKLSKHRIKQIRIRKYPSQGMIIDPEDIQKVYDVKIDVIEKDYSTILNIIKYEPPINQQLSTTFSVKKRKLENSYFKKYGGINNIKWFPDKFKEDETVIVQEKVHGTNVRIGILPFQANTLWRKILKFLRLTPVQEKCYGSNNIQLQNKINKKTFYGDDLYGRILEENNAFERIKYGEIVYGEIYGSNIQKNYTYGCKGNEHKLLIFDIRIIRDNSFYWLTPDEVISFAKERGFDMVPEIYRGKFNLEKMKELTSGVSLISTKQKVREGIVIKSANNYDEGMGGKRSLKFISEKYLDKFQTDFH